MVHLDQEIPVGGQGGHRYTGLTAALAQVEGMLSRAHPVVGRLYSHCKRWQQEGLLDICRDPDLQALDWAQHSQTCQVVWTD